MTVRMRPGFRYHFRCHFRYRFRPVLSAMSGAMGPDRGLRVLVIVPAAILGAPIFRAGTLADVILFVGAGIRLATAAVGFCLTCTMLGISTHPRGCIGRATDCTAATPSSRPQWSRAVCDEIGENYGCGAVGRCERFGVRWLRG
jgi:hypothetical protein